LPTNSHVANTARPSRNNRARQIAMVNSLLLRFPRVVFVMNGRNPKKPLSRSSSKSPQHSFRTAIERPSVRNRVLVAPGIHPIPRYRTPVEKTARAESSEPTGTALHSSACVCRPVPQAHNGKSSSSPSHLARVVLAQAKLLLIRPASTLPPVPA